MRICLILMLCISLPLMAQDEETESPAPPPCSSEKYHQFDFWVRNWNVTSNGQQAGTNSIQKVHKGCALLESWQGTGAGGIGGSSLNIYDQAKDQWHQTWVDDTGNLLELNGGWQDNSMVLQGQRPAEDGPGSVTHRISWTPHGDGTVQQLWDASRDGQTWTVLFDGLYEKVSPENETR